MKTNAQARHKLGLTQEQMAQYLSIRLSQLAMYETNRRDLPTHAMMKLAEIEIFLHQLPAKKKTAGPPDKSQEAKTKQALEKLLMRQEYKAMVAQRKLAAVEQKYAQAKLLLELADHLKSKTSTVVSNEPPGLPANIMELLALQSMKKYGPDKQVVLQVEISGIHHQQEQAMLLKKAM